MTESLYGIELYTAGDNERKVYAYNEQPEYLYDQVKKKFPWVQKSNYISISTPVYHEVLQEPIITCCMPLSFSRNYFEGDVVLGSRKFCMGSGVSFLRGYYKYEEATPEWAPNNVEVLFYTKNYEEYKRPSSELALSFTDYYLSGEPAEVEAFFNLPEKRGAYSTMYGVTVKDGEVLRVKQYCYETKNFWSEWSAVYNLSTTSTERE